MVKSKKLDFKEIRDHCRILRQNMTECEQILWREIKNRKLSGFKFLRQHPIIYKGDLIRLSYFIKEYDNFRDSELEYIGMHILRIKNEELVDLKSVLNKIENYLLSIT